MKKGRKLNEESHRVLQLLLDKGSMSINDLTAIHFSGRFPWDHRRVFLKLYSLRRSGYVKSRDKENQSFFHLTPKGKLQILKYVHLERLKGKKWDGHWRIVIFDLPESLKKWRDYLRNELKSNLGFWPLQESVYITPYPVMGELNELLKEWNLRKYFRYITVTEIDNEHELRQAFGLK